MIYFSLHLAKSNIVVIKRYAVMAIAAVNIAVSMLLVINKRHATALTPAKLLSIIIFYPIEKLMHFNHELPIMWLSG